MKHPIIKLIAKAMGWLFLFLAVFFHSALLVYKWVNPPLTNLMLVRWWDEKNIDSLYNLRNSWVALDKMSPYIVSAMLMAEDPGFFLHQGFYLQEMWKALRQHMKTGKAQASSTITQQTMKNLILWPQKNYFRKLLELYFSCFIEIVWGKERILEVYLNIIELGKNCYGVENGSLLYFSKCSIEICFDEACLLTAITTNPRELNPLAPTNAVYLRASNIFRRGLATAKEEKTGVPLISGKYRLR